MSKNIFLLVTGILFCVIIKAQSIKTTLLNYQNEDLPIPCNIFPSPTTVSGTSFVHKTSFGTPKFRTLNQGKKGIILESYKQSSTRILATQFSIEYPFKAGYKYKIRVYGKFGFSSNTLLSPLLGIRLSTESDEINSSPRCNGPAPKEADMHSNYRNTTLGKEWAWSPYVYEGTEVIDHNFLLVLCTPGIDRPNFYELEEAHIGAIEIVEESPFGPAPSNDESSGAISLTPNGSASCNQQLPVNFNNSTITQWSYEDFGEDGGNSHSFMLRAKGDVWYKFAATNMTHEITVSGQLPSNYNYKIELYSKNGNVLKVIDTENNDFDSSPSIITSGLNVGQEYFIRVILITAIQNNNVSLNICVTTPVIQSPIIKTKTRYESNTAGTYVYDGNTIGLSYAISQNVPESDLSFDWRLVNPNILALEGAFLYAEGGSRVNNGTYSLLNVQGRRVKIGFSAKSPNNPLEFWTFYTEVRIKQVSTNTYLTDWIRAGGGMTEM